VIEWRVNDIDDGEPRGFEYGARRLPGGAGHSPVVGISMFPLHFTGAGTGGGGA
jgi:hypothetical protein